MRLKVAQMNIKQYKNISFIYLSEAWLVAQFLKILKSWLQKCLGELFSSWRNLQLKGGNVFNKHILALQGFNRKFLGLLQRDLNFFSVLKSVMFDTNLAPNIDLEDFFSSKVDAYISKVNQYLKQRLFLIFLRLPIFLNQ